MVIAATTTVAVVFVMVLAAWTCVANPSPRDDGYEDLDDMD